MEPTWTTGNSNDLCPTGEAERITNLKETERVSSTLTQLDEIFPGLRTNFEGASSKCWLDDEWSRGAWSFVGFKDFGTAIGVEGGRIHFAGEHLSQWSSWMQGAISSGLRAVKEIDEAPN